MKYRDPETGEFKELFAKAADTLPVGSVVDYDGEEVPTGWEEVEDPNDYTSEEQLIGTFMGKPLYRKTGSIFFSKIYDGAGHTRGSLISKDIEYSTISKVFGSKLGADSMYNTYDSSIKNNVYIENTPESSDKGYVMGFAGTNTYVGTTLYVVVEYTKTTDTQEVSE